MSTRGGFGIIVADFVYFKKHTITSRGRCFVIKVGELLLRVFNNNILYDGYPNILNLIILYGPCNVYIINIFRAFAV